MRELKFRVWSEEDKEYRTDLNVFRLHDGKIVCTSPAYSLEGDRFDVEQYTGLKDKNGKEIYEGDIVRFRTDHHSKDLEGVGGVSMCELPDSDGWENDGYLCWAIDGYISLSCATTEIIGNIHENEELLEEEE